MVQKCLGIVICFFSFITMSYATGNIQAGQAKSAVCAACHQPDGNSITPIWPNLAGQSERYLIEQLEEFRKGDKGHRMDPVMTPLVQNLSDEDIEDIAAFYASQKPMVGTAKPDLVALGEKIYRGGNLKTGIPACMACHSPSGDGNALAAFPRLSGQQADYTASQLKKFASGARSNGPNGIMEDIAKKMTDEEIQAVSSYVAGLH